MNYCQLFGRTSARYALMLSLLAMSGCALLEKLPPLPTPENLRNAEKQKLSLARLAEERGHIADAANIYRDIIAKNPEHQEAHRRLAVIATREGRWAEADQHFHKAWEIGPQTAPLLSDMGYRLFLEHRLGEAEQLLRQALAQEPRHPAANNNLGLVLGQQNRMEEAMECFRRVNSEAEAHANLAYVLTQMGRVEEAKLEFNQSLSHDKNLRSSAAGLLALSGHLKSMPSHVPPTNMPPATAVADARGMPTQNLQPGSGWQPVATQDARAPLNPQPPSPMPNWPGPPPALQAPGYTMPTGPAAAASYAASPPGAPEGVQPAAYWSANQGVSQPAVYQGPPPPYGGVPVTGRTSANSGPTAIPMHYSNGISPQAGPPGVLPY